MPDGHYHAIILGAGQGGGPLATAFARAGRRTLLIEQAHLGGSCVNVGCTPTKTLVAGARIAHLARRAGEYGVRTGPVTVDALHVRARKRTIVERFRAGSTRALADAGVEVLMGHGRFTGPRTLETTDATGTLLGRATADVVVISTGLRPVRPAIEGLGQVRAHDSTSIMELDVVPRHLVILGGGYVGLEFAQLFRRLGAAVTVVESAPALLGREDPEIADALTRILTDDGITLRLATTAARVVPGPDDSVYVELRDDHSGRCDLAQASHLLLAAGRRPNTDDIGAAAGGVELTPQGFVLTDERLATTADGVYAIGDVKGGPAFTHIAYDDYRILRGNLLEGAARTTHGRRVPYTVFTDPPLGRIGLTEMQARSAGLEIRVARQPMAHVARAIEMDETRGLMKVVVDAHTDRILGAAILGVEGGELATVIQMAMDGNLPWTHLRDMVFPHPSFAESLNNLFSQLG